MDGILSSLILKSAVSYGFSQALLFLHVFFVFTSRL